MITKEQAVQEILKSGKDQEYFVNNFCRIPHSVHGLVRFDTYDFQDQLLADLEKYRFNYSRKMGTARLKALQIKLPANKNLKKPDFEFMENFIKSLKYSSELQRYN